MVEVKADLEDRFWRMQNLYLIRDKDRNRVRPKFKPSQLRIVEAIEDRVRLGQPIRHFDGKCRQSMVTTFWMLYYLDDSIFNRNTRSVILAHKRETLDLIWDAVRFAHASMPDPLRPKLDEDSARVLSFREAGSKMMVSLKLQGGTVNNLHVSEYPLCDPDEIEQTMAACPPSANITLEGVFEGMNHAYDKWTASGDGFTRLFHPWFLQPEYRADPPPGMEWTSEEKAVAEMALRDYGVRLDDHQMQFRRLAHKNFRHLALQEMAEDPISCFLATGNPFFDNRKLQATLRKARLVEPVERSSPRHDRNGRLWYELERWEDPVEGNVYVAGADVADGFEAGGERDYSVLAIMNASTGRTAMRLKAHMKHDEFASACASWCRKYNKAFLAVELPGPGDTIVALLQEKYGYTNLYGESVGDQVRVGKSTQTRREIRYGFRQTKNTKQVILHKFRLAIEGEFTEGPENFRPEIEMLDTEFLTEAFNVRDDAGKIEAASGYHDDVTMAWAITHEMYLLKRVRRTAAERETGGQEGRFLTVKSESARLFGDGS